MGRWDDKPTEGYDKNSPDNFDGRFEDEWNKLTGNDFDWKETPVNKHPKDCDCPKHEELKNMARSRIQSRDNSPIRLKLCPPHFKVWNETKPEMYKNAKWYQKIILYIALRFGWLQVIELKHAQSELCFWCKFGSGGRGIKKDGETPDIPPAQ